MEEPGTYTVTPEDQKEGGAPTSPRPPDSYPPGPTPEQMEEQEQQLKERKEKTDGESNTTDTPNQEEGNPS